MTNDDSEPDSSAYGDRKTGGATNTAVLKAPADNSKRTVSLNLGDRFFIGDMPKPNNPEEADLIDAVSRLSIETYRIENESKSGSCPASIKCNAYSREHGNGNRIGIDPDCSRKKSYHCDVLRKQLEDKFLNYVVANEKNMTEREFKANLEFTLDYKPVIK